MNNYITQFYIIQYGTVLCSHMSIYKGMCGIISYHKNTREELKMTKEERLILINQYQLLKQTSDEEDDQKYWDLKIKILREGWAYLYESELFEVIEEEKDEKVCKEVIDILKMYRNILGSVKNNGGIEKFDGDYMLQFRGFDGNEEIDHYSFMQLYIEDMERFNESKSENSHSNMLSTYREMLERYNEVTKSKYKDLTNEEIKYIVAS